MKCRPRAWLMLFVLLPALLAALPAMAAPPRAIPGELIVRYKRGVGPDARSSSRVSANVRSLKHFTFVNMDHVKVEAGTDEQAMQRLRRNPNVEYVEPNYEWTLDLVPNDPRFPELYGMRNTGQTGGTAGADIKAVSAWDVFTGDPNLKIGVIDTGVDYNHPDLAANVWTNPGEIPGNNIDDDNNGYVDDVHGYDFVNNDGDPFDDNGHGSHCSGTIAGVGNNNVGVVGVNWNAKIVGIKFLSGSGSGSTAGAIAGVQYAIAVGCRLTSNSWGGGAFSQALLDAINAAGAAGQLFVAAAGNSSSNNDATPHYPSSYNTPYIIAVAATDHNDNLASFSSYGATSVDLAAPGVNILSCQPGGGYQLLSGTSMATPHVAGVAALAMGRFPSATNLFIKQQILDRADPKAQLAGRVLTGARLNAFMSIADPDTTPPGTVANLSVTETGSSHLRIQWTATGDDGNTGRAAAYDIRYSTSPINAGNFASATPAGGPTPQTAGATETHEIGGLAFNTTYYVALKALDEFGNAGGLSNVPNGTTLGAPDLAASPGSFSSTLLTGASETQTLALSNVGQGTLDFSIPTPELAFSQASVYGYQPVGKDETDSRPGIPAVNGQGGPDGFGYRWIDSNEPGGPSFAWEDITGTGTQLALTGDDATSAPVALGFDFPYYGGTFNSVRVCTNGWLSFTSTATAYDNQPLPNAGAPANMIAPFWDDLNFGTTPRVYTYGDAGHFVISWVAAPHYSSGGVYTFQAILYPSGEIRYQYLSMGTQTNSATVGIQNATGTIGLTTVFNANYVTDNLAVRYLPLRQWLTVSPASGRIAAGQSQNVNVNFNASGIVGGIFDGTIRVFSNDPTGSPATLAAQLHVIGAPDIALAPALVDFGTFFVGANPTRNLTVGNPGTDALVVTNITTSDADVSPDQTSFMLNPGQSRVVVLTFAPGTARAMTGTVTVHSNDPDTPAASVPMQGTSTPAPQALVSPTSFNESLLTNTAVSRSLRITNNGGSAYTFTAAAEILGQSGSVTVHGDADNVDLDKDAPDVQFGPAPLRAGGPDVFGYTYQDSDEPGGPAFGWVDISGIGTSIPLNADDQNLGPFPLGFNFPYYGATQTQFRICSNGWLTFTPTNTQTTFTNTTLPNSGTTVPPNLLAPFWDDLDYRPSLAPNARAYYHYDGTRTIIQFKAVPRRGESGTTATNDFQVILYPTGEIVYQYLTMNAVLKNSATIGLQNAARNDGLQVVFNANYVKNNLAIRFRPPARFLTVSPPSGSVPAGGFLDLTVGFNAAGLFGGDYTGRVRIAGNDPVRPQVDVPATLHVTGVPDIAANPTSVGFGTVYVGYPQLRQLRILNNGTDALTVSNITSNDPEFGVDQTSFSVPPLGQALLFVSFSPVSPGPQSAALTVFSNDADTPQLVVPLDGNGLPAPDIDPQPASISETLPIPGSSSRTLTVRNLGGSDLNFVVGTQLTATSVPIYEGGELAKEERDPSEGVLGSGGPDVFGYRWRDSDEAGGPVFDWVDITGIGVPVPFASGDDSNFQGVPIGFSFPFYGTSFNTVNVCTNGWLSFTNTGTNLTNNALPSASAPENLLAVFWDDLLPGTTPARVFRYSDGTRFIVSFVGVPRFSSGGPYTFQVILYPSGRIVYQYLDMQGTRLNEATIGIQNAARNDGLTVVFNAGYVHNNLAVELATVPEYLTVNPTSGMVPAGGSMNLNLNFNTTGLFGGTYDGSIRITSNDPDEAVKIVPTSLTAVGTPQIAASPASLDFGTLYVGLTADRNVTLRNVGSDVLTISSLGFDNPDFALVSTPSLPVSLGQNGTLPLTVRWTPSAGCSPCTGNLSVGSNDPDDNPLGVALTGIGVVPPEIGVTPASLRAALATTLGPTAIATTKKLVIENTGGSDLNWTAEALSALPAAIVGPTAEGAKDDAGTPGTLGNGGPDAFGYRWVDSDSPLGPAFDWVDITTVGTPIPFTGDDQNQGPFPLPFPFTFYGNTFNSFRACSNGWISFTSTATTFTNTAFPSGGTTAPENAIAPFWDDLTFSAAGDVYYHYDGSKFIISFVAVPRLTSGGPYTFQILLYPSGTIDFQYLDMQGTRLNEATVGIQNATRDVGLQMVFNAPYVHDGLRVRISNQPGWLTLNRTSGTTPAGGRDTVEVRFDATGLADGDYTGSVRVASNDLDEPLVTVPCDLHVGVATAVFDLDPGSLNLSSSGQWVSGDVTPPGGANPMTIRTSSVLLERTVPVDAAGPISYPMPHARYKFNRSALQAVLTPGPSVPVECIGEVADVTWFRGVDYIKVLPPRGRVANANSGTTLPEGVAMVVTWDDPEGFTPTSYGVWGSTDAGATWTELGTGITSHFFSWLPTGGTGEVMMELVAFDGEEPVGSWRTEVFTIGGQVTGVGDEPVTAFGLRFAGRNPSAHGAAMQLAMPAAGPATVQVFDVRGALVRQLVGGELSAGHHVIRWDGRDRHGAAVGAGLYFVHASRPGQAAIVRRFTLLR